MTTFHEYLLERLEIGGFSTEDTLASFLPLVREVLDAHAAGLVAPLEGFDALHVETARIWFEESQRAEPRSNLSAVRRVEAAARASVEIVSEQRRTVDVDEGRDELVNLAVGDRDAKITRPVYLPGYVSWEHLLEHHDPLTDVFSLGMILASLACGIDLAEPDRLKPFVASRKNLFTLAPDLHPVLARAIFRMTDLDRHRRPQDLRALLHHLENYRDQDVDFEFDLARISGLEQKDNRNKQHVVLSKLKERLFEISRRNRLLHFRPTMQTVNLTHSSVPLSFDIKNIRPDQILIWNDTFHAAVCSGKPVSLNKYLNFAEALYLPGVLDRIIAEAHRDQAEFGFAQLRLVVCFLHWANLKETPVEQFDSPLVLLPVELKKKKGIRDTYTLVAPSAEAEINPVVRHQFKQLYGIDLPEQIDLASSSLDHFYEYLLVEEDGELVQYDLESNSFLNHAARNLPATMLGWHYRSRSESLISFSNWMFYDGRLLTVPEERLPVDGQISLIATDTADAQAGAGALLERPVSFHFMDHGVYDKRRNRAEADYIAHLVCQLLTESSGRTIGVVAFSEAQQNEIEGALQRLAQTNADFGNLLDAELEREEDGQFVGLLVKNLENIQGDERDIIILSVCYGYGPNGKMLMNFGPINKSGGEKRLNVAFSRAKHHMALVSSIRHTDITNDYNDGANCLKNYLCYAEAVSGGNIEAARRVLHGMSRWHTPDHDDHTGTDDAVAEQLATALTGHGFIVDRQVGQSHFRCDLAVRRQGDHSYRLGILLDSHAYYEQADLLERDMMRPRLLRVFGWPVAFVLAKDWYDDPGAVVTRLLQRLEGRKESSEEEAEEEEVLIDEQDEEELLDENDVEEEDDEEEEAQETDDRNRETAPGNESPLPVTNPLQVESEIATGPESTAVTPTEEPSAPSAESGLSPAGPTRHFEYAGGSSNKFWEITLSGNSHTVCFGRIGTKGQTRTKQFDTPAQAENDYQRLIRSKLAKGYRET